MKEHVGVDSKEKLVHSVEMSPASDHDSQMVSELRHGDETKVWGDSAYQGQKEAIKAAAPAAKDTTNRRALARTSPVRQKACEEHLKI